MSIMLRYFSEKIKDLVSSYSVEDLLDVFESENWVEEITYFVNEDIKIILMILSIFPRLSRLFRGAMVYVLDILHSSHIKYFSQVLSIKQFQQIYTTVIIYVLMTLISRLTYIVNDEKFTPVDWNEMKILMSENAFIDNINLNTDYIDKSTCDDFVFNLEIMGNIFS